MNIKEAAKDFWNFIWKEDSLASWIVSLILAFIIVKFIFFPLLSFAFGTPLPLVVVESGSMHHPGNLFGNIFQTKSSFETFWTKSSVWYLEHNINKEKFLKFSLSNGLEIGDIVIASGRANYKIGDIIIFNANQAYPIIHRIINITEKDGKQIYSTKGDNNPGQLQIEEEITKEQILGKAILRIPRIGWIKLFFVKLIQ